MSFYRFYFYFLLSTTICSFASEDGSPTTVQEAQTPPINKYSKVFQKSLLTIAIEKAQKNGSLKKERNRALTCEQLNNILDDTKHNQAMANIGRHNSAELYDEMIKFSAQYRLQKNNGINPPKSAPAKVNSKKPSCNLKDSNEINVIKNQLERRAAKKI